MIQISILICCITVKDTCRLKNRLENQIITYTHTTFTTESRVTKSPLQDVVQYLSKAWEDIFITGVPSWRNKREI